VTYSYDELGERTRATPGSGPATTYGYDQASDLTSVARPHEGEVSAIEDSYGYDGDGLRASQTISGTTSYMSWDAADALPLLLSDGTSVFIYGSGGLPIEQVSGETVQYLHHDQQGSTRMITAAAGTVAGATTFDAYGNKLASTGSATTALGYDGQYTSADTGLIYLRARVYDSASAQFLSRDPLEAFTREAYGYAGSDPVNRLDRSGLSEEGEHPCPPGALCLPPPPNPIKAGEELVTGVAEGAGKTWGGIKTLWNDVTGANDAEEDGEGPGIPASEECELVQTPAPPGFDPDAWTKGPASRPSDPGENYYDPEGGEWNYHPPDKYHDTPHWNYKPPTPWNAEWKNIYP
jgi:RHS repeat-associated protein